VPPGGSAQAVFEADLREASVLEARLDGSDALAADDRAWLVRRVGPVRVALVGDASPPLRRALASAGETETVEFPDPPEAAVPPGFDLAVYCHAVPRQLSAGSVVVVAPRASVGSLRLLDGTEQGPPTVVEPRDPLMAAVELEGVMTGPVPRVAVPAGFQVLARAGTEPLVGRWREGQAAGVYVGADPAAGDWALKAAFPIFWTNVVAAAVEGAGSEFACVRPGAICRLGGSAGRATVAGPDGERHEASGGVFRPLHVGLYRSEGGEGRAVLAAVSLLSEDETLAAGTGSSLSPSEPTDEASSAANTVLPLGGWMAFLALLLLLAHGALAARR